MTRDLQPDEAMSALAEIRRHQEGVIGAVLVPVWYWLVIAVGMVAIGAAADTRSPGVLAAVLPVAVVLIAGLTVAMILGLYRRVQVRSSDLLGGRGAIAIVGFTGLVIGLTLGIGFSLRAAGVPAPATIATAVGGIVLVFGGRLLMRKLRDIMLANRAGSSQ